MSSHSPLFADISSNNPSFDAAQYRAAGHVAIAIKATEGTFYTNPNHRGWCLHAGWHHISVIHYHFARPDLGDGPEAEARHFLQVAHGLAGGRDYLALDLERATPQGWQHDPAWSYSFDNYIQAHSRFHTVLYANRSTLEQSDRWLHGDKRRVWEADWSAEHDYAPNGYGVFARQQSGDGVGPGPHSLPGVGFCDVNVLRRHAFAAVTARLP